MGSRRLLKPLKKWNKALISITRGTPYYSLQLMIEVQAGRNPDQSDWEIAYEHIDYHYTNNEDFKVVVVDDLDDPRPTPMEIPDED